MLCVWLARSSPLGCAPWRTIRIVWIKNNSGVQVGNRELQRCDAALFPLPDESLFGAESPWQGCWHAWVRLCYTCRLGGGDAAGTPRVGQPAWGADGDGGWEPCRSQGARSHSCSRRSALPGVLWLLVAAMVLEAAGDFSVFWRCQFGRQPENHAARARGFLKIPVPDPKCGPGPTSVLHHLPWPHTFTTSWVAAAPLCPACRQCWPKPPSSTGTSSSAEAGGWLGGGRGSGMWGFSRCPNTCSHSITCCACHRGRFGCF